MNFQFNIHLIAIIIVILFTDIVIERNRYETKLRGLRDDIIEEKHNLDVQLHANEQLMEKLIQADLEREKSLRNYWLYARNNSLERYFILKTFIDLKYAVTFFSA